MLKCCFVSPFSFFKILIFRFAFLKLTFFCIFLNCILIIINLSTLSAISFSSKSYLYNKLRFNSSVFSNFFSFPFVLLKQKCTISPYPFTAYGFTNANSKVLRSNRKSRKNVGRNFCLSKKEKLDYCAIFTLTSKSCSFLHVLKSFSRNRFTTPLMYCFFYSHSSLCFYPKNNCACFSLLNYKKSTKLRALVQNEYTNKLQAKEGAYDIHVDIQKNKIGKRSFDGKQENPEDKKLFQGAITSYVSSNEINENKEISNANKQIENEDKIEESMHLIKEEISAVREQKSNCFSNENEVESRKIEKQKDDEKLDIEKKKRCEQQEENSGQKSIENEFIQIKEIDHEERHKKSIAQQIEAEIVQEEEEVSKSTQSENYAEKQAEEIKKMKFNDLSNNEEEEIERLQENDLARSINTETGQEYNEVRQGKVKEDITKMLSNKDGNANLLYNSVFFRRLPNKCNEEQFLQILEHFGFEKTKINRFKLFDSALNTRNNRAINSFSASSSNENKRYLMNNETINKTNNSDDPKIDKYYNSDLSFNNYNENYTRAYSDQIVYQRHAKVSFENSEIANDAIKKMNGKAIPNYISKMWLEEDEIKINDQDINNNFELHQEKNSKQKDENQTMNQQKENNFLLQVSLPYRSHLVELVNIPLSANELDIVNTLENYGINGIRDVRFSEYKSMRTALITLKSFNAKIKALQVKNLVINGQLTQVGRFMRANHNSAILRRLPTDWTREDVKEVLEHLNIKDIVAIHMPVHFKILFPDTPFKFAFVQFGSADSLAEALEKAEDNEKLSNLVMQRVINNSSPEKQIYVGNIPRDISKKYVKEFLVKKLARIESVRFPGVTMQPIKPYSFVSFDNEESVSKFLSYNGHSIGSSTIHVGMYRESSLPHTAIITYLPTNMDEQQFRDWLDANVKGVISVDFRLPLEKNLGYAFIDFLDEEARDEVLNKNSTVSINGVNLVFRRPVAKNLNNYNKDSISSSNNRFKNSHLRSSTSNYDRHTRYSASSESSFVPNFSSSSFSSVDPNHLNEEEGFYSIQYNNN